MGDTLHTYFRSSASYRVRIALNLKQMTVQHVAVHLNRYGGEQFGAPFLALNPQSLVPVFSDGVVTISQSLAIMEYLDEIQPAPPLLPEGAAARARVRQVALAIACDIHPLNNLRVLKYIAGQLGADETQKTAWAAHWIRLGLQALEDDISRSYEGGFCVGRYPTMADCCLIPQLFSARRFDVDVEAYPTLRKIETICDALPAFADAHPSRQPDAE
jgi:maleylpyruvate isomerase